MGVINTLYLWYGIMFYGYGYFVIYGYMYLTLINMIL